MLTDSLMTMLEDNVILSLHLRQSLEKLVKETGGPELGQFSRTEW